MATDVVFLGDDFTGASDSLATYARSGWRARLVLGRPSDPQPGDLDALGIATDLRSLDPDRARAEIARLWPLIEATAPGILHFKTCSTFDSSPELGSIGAVVRDLAARFRPDVIAVIGGQPSLGRHCLFGNLFARGPDGRVHRIDRHPVMSRHPVTPMSEADLRLHLAAQGLDDLRLVPFTDLADTDAIAATLRTGPVLFDVASQQDQTRIAEALRLAGGRQLLIGASSVAEILGQTRPKPVQVPSFPPPAAPGVFLFAGSRSAVTDAQVRDATGYTKLALTPEALRSNGLLDEAAQHLQRGAPVMVHLLPDADYGLSPDALADASSGFVTALLDRVDIGYLGLAGGDTSSRICAALGFDALDFEENLGHGVCVCTAAHRAPRRDRMRVMLKGGQMGAPDLFDQFAARSAVPAPH